MPPAPINNLIPSGKPLDVVVVVMGAVVCVVGLCQKETWNKMQK